jgi:hypothetical protein
VPVVGTLAVRVMDWPVSIAAGDGVIDPAASAVFTTIDIVV